MNSSRFSRWEQLDGFGANEITRLQNSSVAIVGVGGLGCPSGMYLAAAGVRRITLIDDGLVDPPDLGRQVLYSPSDCGGSKARVAMERLRQQNPDIEVRAVERQFDLVSGPDLLQGIDLVIDGTDSLGARRAINLCVLRAGICAVFGGVVGWTGFVQTVLSGSACYDCVWSDRTHCGSCDDVGVVGPLVGMVGAAQAVEAIKVITGVGEVLTGRLLLIDAFRGTTRTLNTFRRDDCQACQFITD